MVRRLALAYTIVLPLITGAAHGQNEFTVVPSGIKWRDFPLAKGVQVTALYGGVDKTGIYTLRVKMESGSRLSLHTHPDTRMITVLSGTLFAGRDMHYNRATETAVPAGGFFVVPAETPHYTRAGDGEVIYQENGFGPSPTITIDK